jgi:lipopolysaccharide export system protein LptA
MSAQTASVPVRVARLAAAAVLVALAVAVVVRLAARREERPAAPSPAPVAAGPVDLKTNVVHEEYRDGRLVAVVRGQNFSLGPDGRNRLRGAVDVANYGPGGEVTSRLEADEVSYAKDTLLFEIAGGVRIEAGGMTLEGDAFEYDKADGLFHTASGGRFSSRSIGGSAGEISYAENAGEIRLGGGFTARLAAGTDPGEALGLSGRSLRYDRRERRGRIEGEAVVEGPDFRGASRQISFVAAADEAGLDSAVLEDAAAVVLRGRGASGGGEIRADRLEVVFSREPSGLAVEASGRAVLSTSSGEGGGEKVAAASIRLDLFRKDGPWTWEARGGVRAELAETGGAGRVVEGEEAVFDGARSLRVAAATGGRAVADSGEARLEAARISLGTASGSLSAEGAVLGVLKAGDGSRQTAFFARGEDVAISCERLETRPEAGSMRLSGSVIIRQASVSVRGGEIELIGDAGRMSGGGGVAVTLAEGRPEDGPGRAIELAGQDLQFRPDTRTLILTEKASIRFPEARLEAGAISAVVARDGRTVETVEAKTGVVVAKGRFSGRSEAASYDAAAGRISLTGRPVLTDGKGGSARGAKLTFDLADDKILIENEGPGRATAVVRS